MYFRLRNENCIQFGEERILKRVLLGRKKLNRMNKVMLKSTIKQVSFFKTVSVVDCSVSSGEPFTSSFRKVFH